MLYVVLDVEIVETLAREVDILARVEEVGDAVDTDVVDPGERSFRPWLRRYGSMEMWRWVRTD